MQSNLQSGRLQPPPTLPSRSSSSSVLLPQSDDAPPHKVPVHSHFARVTPTEPGDPFPSISPQDQVRVKAWIERDLQFEREVSAARQRKRAEVTALVDDIVNGQDWLGPNAPPGQFKIRWDEDRDREQASKCRGPLRKPIKLSKRQLRAAASRSEVLIPIRLELEHEAWKLRDTFTWNLLETDITPETFASHLCADLRLPERPFLKDIVTTIKKAIEDAKSSAQYDGPLPADELREMEETRHWFAERAHERRRRPLMDELPQGDLSELQSQVTRPTMDELRVAIKLDITLDATQLVDRVEWDIGNPRNSPEEFAETFASELGLTGEFTTAIAHSIREQVDTYVKSLSLLNYDSTGTVADDDLRREFLPALGDVFRSDTDVYSPSLVQLSMEDLDRNEREREREIRRKRRQTKTRGVALPDREAVKTHRTLVPRPLPGLMQTQLNGGDVVYPLPELSHPVAVMARPLPPKPQGLETSESSPLRLLVNDRDGPAGPSTTTLRGAAAYNAALKRARLTGADPPAEPVEQGRPEDFGLHPHMLNGVWHCANCGIPDSLAVGRRKGPTGVRNLCGTCGKFYQRFRKQRGCKYTTDYDTHFRQVNPSKARRLDQQAAAAAALPPAEGNPAHIQSGQPDHDGLPRLASRDETSTTSLRRADARQGGDDDEDQEEGEDSDDSAPVRPPRRKRRANHYGSPDTPFVADDSNSDSNSDEDSSNDEDEANEEPPPPPPPRAPAPVQPRPTPAPPPPPQVAAPATSSRTAAVPPEPLPWMLAAASDLRARQVDDRFELIPKPKAGDPSSFEWRIRCLDCPGKLYNLGPGQTFDGFQIHFKNRNHRTNVETRLASQPTPQ
ncbi:hypothetical protein JCM11491_004755 [Sporobolomyces phaffii]